MQNAPKVPAGLKEVNGALVLDVTREQLEQFGAPASVAHRFYSAYLEAEVFAREALKRCPSDTVLNCIERCIRARQSLEEVILNDAIFKA